MSKWKEEEVLTNLVVEWNREVLVYYSEQKGVQPFWYTEQEGKPISSQEGWLNVNDVKSAALKMKRNEGDSHSETIHSRSENIWLQG